MKLITSGDVIALIYDMMIWTPYENPVKLLISTSVFDARKPNPNKNYERFEII